MTDLLKAWCTAALVWLKLLAVVTAASGAEPPCYCPVVVIGEPHDLDTWRADILLPWGVTLRNRSLRLDFDAWEVNRVRQTVKVTSEEIIKGKAALAAFQELRSKADAVYVTPTERESGLYDRLSVSAWLRMRDTGELVSVKAWAEKNGHVRPEKRKP